MKTTASTSLWLVALLLLAGCSTPASRIQQRQAEFEIWPAEVQKEVRAGRIAVGYTKAMVRMALGEPDRQRTRTTAEGEAVVWVYFDHSPKFSFGLGMGTSGSRSAAAVGMTAGDSGWRDEEVLRVVFADDRVSAIERRK